MGAAAALPIPDPICFKADQVPALPPAVQGWGRGIMQRDLLVLFLLVGCAIPLPAAAETVSRASIGCDTPAATLMAEQALQDKISGRDHNAMDRITAYQKEAGPQSCRPLSQGDKIALVREGDEMVCVREQDERLNGPGAPTCYWMRRRYIKLPQ